MGHGHLPHHAGMALRKELTRVIEVDFLDRSTGCTYSRHPDPAICKADQIAARHDCTAASHERDSEALQGRSTEAI